MTQKYLKLEIEIQVSHISKLSGWKQKFIRSFFGRNYSSAILFRDLLTFTQSTSVILVSKRFENNLKNDDVIYGRPGMKKCRVFLLLLSFWYLLVHFFLKPKHMRISFGTFIQCNIFYETCRKEF